MSDDYIARIKALSQAEDEMVRELGDKIGYGNMMHKASIIRQESDLGAKGAFVPGPCKGMVVPCVCVGVDLDGSHCDWCCGCGWLTEAVSKLVSGGRVEEVSTNKD